MEAQNTDLEIEMDIKKIIRNINEDNDGIGNSAIYDKCKVSIYVGENEAENKKNETIDRLWGMIWLIGRSYAASPQRRSYGKSKHIKTYTDTDGKEKQRSVWPVRSENSGNGDFFKEIASYIVNRNIENSDDYDKLGNLINNLKDAKYKFDITADTKGIEKCDDFKALVGVITAVSKLNRIIKRATEKFDLVYEYCKNHAHKIPPCYVTDKSERDIDYVYCKNQISFSSKFLHFFCPDAVFIIDQFSEKGGKLIFSNTNKTSKKYYISDGMYEEGADNEVGEEASYGAVFEPDEAFESEIDKYKKLKMRLQKELKNKLEKEAELDKSEILNRRRNADDNNIAVNPKDWLIWGYLNHVVNSYLLCLYIKDTMGEDFNVKVSYPRLTDSVFMRTKEFKKINNDSVKVTNDDLKKIYYVERGKK